jgi:hypothetical protein
MEYNTLNFQNKMALTDDLSNRLTTGGEVTNVSRLIRIKEMAQLGPTAVTLNTIDNLFTPVKDMFSGLILLSATQLFERWCSKNGFHCEFDVNYYAYLVKAQNKRA